MRAVNDMKSNYLGTATNYAWI